MAVLDGTDNGDQAPWITTQTFDIISREGLVLEWCYRFMSFDGFKWVFCAADLVNRLMSFCTTTLFFLWPPISLDPLMHVRRA